MYNNIFSFLVSQQRIHSPCYGNNRSHRSKNQIKICRLRNSDFATTCPSRVSEWKDFGEQAQESVWRHFPDGRRQKFLEDLKLFRINFSGKCNQICPINIQGDGSRWQGVRVKDSQTPFYCCHFLFNSRYVHCKAGIVTGSPN